jgi:hypothetical protein
MRCNQNQLPLVSYTKVDDIIKKTDYDLYALDIAQKLFTIDKEIKKKLFLKKMVSTNMVSLQTILQKKYQIVLL